jgi:hypothetical protein
MFTREQRLAAFEVITAIAEAIRALGEVPSGELYARVMHKFDERSYRVIIETLKGAKLVEEKNHLLRWIGPKFDADGRRR